MIKTDASYPDTRLLIGGQWRDAAGGKKISVVNPATGQAIGHVAHAATVDLDAALAAAKSGFHAWRSIPAAERAAMMRETAGLLRDRADAIARLITQEQGKPLAEARVEVLAGAGIIEWFADEGMRVYGRIVPSRKLAAQQLVLKEPVGLVAAFTPWNFPINQVVRKLSAALATGCSFLLKAPEETLASPAALLQTFVDAGVPTGTVGLVFGDPAEISNYLIASPIIRKVTFTGSTPVGKQLAALAGQHMKRVTTELGGHAPVIVAEDADADVFNNEPFGPVAAIRTFNALEEAIVEANRLPYGLAGYAFTKSIKTTRILANRLELGMLWINQPTSHAVARDAVRRCQGLRLRHRRWPRGAGTYLVTKAVSILGT